MVGLPMDSMQTPTAQAMVQAPQWVQASNSMTCRVAMFAGSDFSSISPENPFLQNDIKQKTANKSEQLFPEKYARCAF